MLEATIALRVLADRMTGPVLDESALVYKPNFNLRGPERMVIGFDRIRPADQRPAGDVGSPKPSTAPKALPRFAYSAASDRCITGRKEVPDATYSGKFG